jgi:hypothetical protein
MPSEIVKNAVIRLLRKDGILHLPKALVQEEWLLNFR